ncbi:MAG: hypothetical protein AAF483_16075 [Planctomycetota bacterium]
MDHEFPDSDLKGGDQAYAEATDAFSPALPKDFRKSYCLFVAATTSASIEYASLPELTLDVDYNPEEDCECMPSVDPQRMKRVAKALDNILAVDYHAIIREAWSVSNSDDSSFALGRFATVEEYLDYLESWIAAFQKIREGGYVIGLGFNI